MIVPRFSGATAMRFGQAALLPLLASAFAPTFAPSLGHRQAVYAGLRPISTASSASLFGRRASRQGAAQLRAAYTTTEKGSFPSEVSACLHEFASPLPHTLGTSNATPRHFSRYLRENDTSAAPREEGGKHRTGARACTLTGPSSMPP